jgi:TonB-dependent starch-binding outer membrane protein SusC
MKKKIFITVMVCLLGILQLIAQQQTITGTITDNSDGSTLPGVAILAIGTSNGTVTDIDGNYSITIDETVSILEFSFMGMRTETIEIGTSTVINVQMESDNIGLDEVVVIGYGSVKKSDLTGSVALVDMGDLAEIPASSFDKKMQGRVAGVQVTTLSGQPGGATSMKIRGANSIMSGTQPLYVIDGVLMGSEQNLSWIGSPAENGLSSINPNDIESINILKDASATAIYGARGANGVVIITTKKGKPGKDKISFKAYIGMQQKASSIDVMNASQFASLYNDAGFNADSAYVPLYPNPDSLGLGTNWQDEIYRTAPIQNYQLTFSGGSEKTQYTISGDYFLQDGIIVGSDFTRYSFRMTLDQQVNKKLKIGTSIGLNRTINNTVPTDTPGGFFPGVVNTALTFNPTLPIYDEEGNYTLTDPNADAWLDNPVAVTRSVQAVSKINRLIGNVYLEYDIIKDLKFKTSLATDIYQQTQDMYTPRTVYSGSFNDGQARFSTADFQTLLTENTLSYNKHFANNHQVNAVVGMTFQKNNNRSYINISTGFPNDILGYYGIENAENMPNIYTSFDETAILSYLGRINYNITKKYLFTVTGRVDGSSRFGSNYRYAFFPSAAIAWRMIEEDFVQNMGFFSDLKLRVSYGRSGNDRFRNYAYISTITGTEYFFNGGSPATGFAPDFPANANLKWEKTDQFDIGVDMGFIDSRISIIADYYHKNTTDMLYNSALPYTSGYSSYFKNIGNIRNSGFEFNIRTANLVNKFKWNTDFNISFNSNKILDLGGQTLYIDNDTYKLKVGSWSVIQEGEQLGSFYGLEADGIWQLNEADEAAVYGMQPGDFKYIDQNNDEKIDAADRKIIGHALPKFFWGMNNSFSYGNISLNIFIQGQHGNEILNSNRFELESGNGLSNASVNMLDRWTPENPSNEYPRANREADYLHMSDRYLENGSYIRIKVITLSYTLPSHWMQSLKIDNARFYVTGENLFTFTKYTGFDPEVGRFGFDNTRMGYDYGGYPSAKSYILGVILNF